MMDSQDSPMWLFTWDQKIQSNVDVYVNCLKLTEKGEILQQQQKRGMVIVAILVHDNCCIL